MTKPRLHYRHPGTGISVCPDGTPADTTDSRVGFRASRVKCVKCVAIAYPLGVDWEPIGREGMYYNAKRNHYRCISCKHEMAGIHAQDDRNHYNDCPIMVAAREAAAARMVALRAAVVAVDISTLTDDVVERVAAAMSIVVPRTKENR